MNILIDLLSLLYDYGDLMMTSVTLEPPRYREVDLGGRLCDEGRQARKKTRSFRLRENDRRVLGTVAENVRRHEVPGIVEKLRQGQHFAGHYEED